MKEQRIKCKECGERFTYYRLGAGRPPLYCPTCSEERKRDQARERMVALRVRQQNTAHVLARSHALMDSAAYLVAEAHAAIARSHLNRPRT